MTPFQTTTTIQPTDVPTAMQTPAIHLGNEFRITLGTDLNFAEVVVKQVLAACNASRDSGSSRVGELYTWQLVSICKIVKNCSACGLHVSLFDQSVNCVDAKVLVKHRSLFCEVRFRICGSVIGFRHAARAV